MSLLHLVNLLTLTVLALSFYILWECKKAYKAGNYQKQLILFLIGVAFFLVGASMVVALL